MLKLADAQLDNYLRVDNANYTYIMLIIYLDVSSFSLMSVLALFCINKYIYVFTLKLLTRK